jgi:hypothetical protein
VVRRLVAGSADWLRITDSHLASRLDRIKTRLNLAESGALAGPRARLFGS